MTETFFIGDTHFGHKNILKYEADKRPFKSLEDMHSYMISEWNKVVSDKDTVWHLGDVVFGKSNLWILDKLNGNKKLILGNHDGLPLGLYAEYFSKIYGLYGWNSAILSHIPVHTNQVDYRFTHNIHGHMHNKTLGDKRYINVSCEQLPNLAPISADIILKRMKEDE